MKLFSPTVLENNEKKITMLFATVSFLMMGTILLKTINLPTFNLFQNKNNIESSIIANKNASPTAISDVVTAALAFKATLTTTQQATLQQTYTAALARKWSNLPCGSSCRNGVQFSTLTAAQLLSAKSVIQAAIGTGANNGYEEFIAIINADAYLGANGGGSGYSSGIYFISFLGTPSTTGSWMLQFGGHHFASNIAFNNGHVIGATPYFMGVEPTTFTYNSVAYAPLEDERTGFRDMLASLTSTQFTTAKLSTTFSDCLMSPGETNGNTNTMPATKQGLVCIGLSTAQQNLVIAAMQNYVGDLDSTTATSLMSLYTSELNSTYIAFTGSATAGSASTFLSTNTNYVRIDGPHVWIEFVCQTGVVFPSQIHYHTVWRDHVSDYGVNLAGSAIDNLSTNNVSLASNLKIYPNPTTDFVNLSFATEQENVIIKVCDMTGKTVLTTPKNNGLILKIDVSNLPNSNYIIKGEDQNQKIFTGKFIKK